MIEPVNNTKVKLTASTLDPWRTDVLYARMCFLESCGWKVIKRRYVPESLTIEVIMEKDKFYDGFVEVTPCQK